MSKPAKDTILLALLIALGGAVYYLIVRYTPFAPPCLIKLMTGYECPSCGITHMFIDLMHLRIRAAFRDNPFTFIAWIPTTVEVLYLRYMYSAKKDIPRSNFVFIYILCGSAFLFGILRNIF